VVLIGDQRFGDQGPMDDMARGLDRCQKDFGYEIKKVESITASAHEDDVRAMAQQYYDLIMTTFPEMSPATEKVASEFPKIKFAAIYQFINLDGKSVPNVWDTEYRGDSTYYILGVVATMLSKSKKLGFISGSEDPTINGSMNAFGQAVKKTDPSATVEYAFAGSYEDPAKGNDIAKAMTQRGADVLTTAAAKTQLGVIDGAKSAKALFIGDVADNSKLYPEGFVGYSGSTFGQNVYLGCKSVADNTFQGGKHTFIDLTNGGYYIPYDAIQNWGKASNRAGDADAVTKAAKDLEAKVSSGELKIDHDTSTPKS
jgi:basic membrane protein A